ncbi:SusC/RagA family TonB-linked outer membrane protein [Pedobacter sp. ISL-68]|uniref:SusC/RagA family TonB-linked outer membrane protein n=1 Tax=unclassified Pedobacter TaxID=2628915 RepID=UPI001BE649B6|nr:MULTISPECIES: SusC/RagA family TonB-linked outer membrane protein [unclassified Pedobacter]MBT2560203.1 SusC/RagA family TonB-linked outer membrane protein [Pedobacter sp. ISL-64]MBT2589182.1 SusC/RagA family TonB-linked outer membrane protein [Pedobacter sp. ISL-68]
MYKNFTSLGLPNRQLRKLLLVMRLTAMILMVAFMQLSASTKAQKVSIVEKNAPLENVLKEIRKQSGYDIIYDLNIVLDAKPVSINVQQVNVFEALQKSLFAQSLTFSVDGRTIIIRERGVVDQIAELVDDHEVKVLVTDSLNRPLPGANVYNKTINKMYVTDKSGEILIKDIPANGYVLQITYVGTKGEEIFVDRKTVSYVVILRQQAAALQEINIVSNGYQKLSRERAAGAYSVVSAKELMETPAVNILERLEGKVAGVKFDIKGNSVQIRGVNSYAGGSGTPLIVLDGFPLMNSSDLATLTNPVGKNAWGNSVISSINIADIEQITFLKDASATSIWGSRAANGVIVIDTKKGKKIAPSINLGYVFGISKNPSIANLRWMNSAQYIDLEQEMVNKGFLVDPALAFPGNEIYSANNSEATEWMYRVKRGTATVAQRDAALAEIGSRDGMAQIEDHLLQNAVNHQYNLSYSGGTESSTYYISGNYTKDVPIYKSNFGENAFINANTTTDLFNKKVTFRALFNYQFSKSQYNAAAVNALSVSTTALRPYDMLQDANGNSIGRTILFRESLASTMVAKGYLPFSYNTMDELNYSNSTSKNNVFRMTAGLNGKIAKWLNADVSASNQRQIGNSYTLDELNSYAGRILVNTGTVITNGKSVYNVPYGGRYITYGTESSETAFRGQLNSDFNIAKNHQFNAIAGAEIRETESSNTSETRYGFNEDTRTIATVNPTGQYETMYGYTQSLGPNLSNLISYRKRFLSYYGNASYSFKEKYFVTGSVRFDDYTLLGIDRSKRAVPFWSVGLRWNANKEEFIENLGWLDALSVRATIGTSGVVPQGGSNVTVISITGTDFRTGQTVGGIETPANSDLGWETTKTGNLGLDFGFFKGRLSGTFDVYRKRTKGILASFAFNPTYGWSNLFFNSGTLSGSGYEFSLNGEIIRAGKFTWKAILNFGYATNKVTDLRYVNNASTLAGTSGTIEGMPLGSLYVYKWAGLDNKGQSQIFDRNNKIINNTTNLTSAFTKEDLVYAGRIYAPYNSGFNHSFKYGQFEMGIQMTGYFGHVFLKNSITNYPTFEGSYSGVLGRQEDLAYRWRVPGDELNTNVPGLSGVNFNSINRYRNADVLVRKADNIRLQQISLSYVVPARFLPRNTFKAISLSANVRNLGIIWRANKDGIDPEFINNGNFGSVTPTPSYVFGINATL